MTVAEAVIDVPEGWECREPGAHALLAQPVGQDGAVRPTLVVDRAVTRGPATIDAYAAAQLAGLHVTFGGHLIHADVTPGPVPALDLAMAVEQLGVDLTVVQRHLWSEDGETVVATGSCPDADWPAVAGDLTAAVRSLRPAPGGAR